MRAGYPGDPFPQLHSQKYFRLAEAFVKWGGFASPSSQATPGPSARPTLDYLIGRGTRLIKNESPASSVEDETPPPPPPPEEPHKPFNHEFDEPDHSTETQTSASLWADKSSSARPQSLLTMQREGKHLSRKQKALLQAAAISRTPLPNLEEKALAGAGGREAKGAEAASESRVETDEEKKQFQNRVWNLVKAKWF